MLSVKGTFENGVARPEKVIEGQEGRTVIITFVDEDIPANAEATEQAASEADEQWDLLLRLVDDYAVETGIADFAYQHDHYIHGTPKRD